MTTTKARGRLKERSKARNSPGLVLPLVKDHLLQEMVKDDGRDQTVIHASEMAKEDWCIRATWYRIKGRPQPPREYNFVLENILAEGTSIHEKWQGWLADTGRLWGNWYCLSCGISCLSVESGRLPAGEYGADSSSSSHAHLWKYNEIPLAQGHIVGHADGAIDDTMIELKSVGVGTLRSEANSKLQKYYIREHKIYDLNALWKDINRPFMSHLRQGNLYLWLAEQMGLPFRKMTFVYEFKPFQQVKEFTVTKSDRILRPLLDRADKLAYHLDNGDEPPECEFGGCKQCEAYESGSAKEVRPAGRSRRVRGRTGSVGGTGQGESTRPEAPAKARRRRTTAAARDDQHQPGRRSADEPVQPARRVVGLPGPAAQSRAGGRAGRRITGLQG